MATRAKLNKQSFEQKQQLVRTKVPDATKPRAKAGSNKTAKKPAAAGTSKAQGTTGGQSAGHAPSKSTATQPPIARRPLRKHPRPGQRRDALKEIIRLQNRTDLLGTRLESKSVGRLSTISFESKTSYNLSQSPMTIFKSIQPPDLSKPPETPEPEPDIGSTANTIFGGAWSNPASELQKASLIAGSRFDLQQQTLSPIDLPQPENPENGQQLGGPHDRSHRTKPAKPPAKKPAAAGTSKAQGLLSKNADARPQKTPSTTRGKSAGHAPDKSTTTQPPTAPRPPRKHPRPGRRRDLAVKEIIRLQNRTDLLVPKLPFRRLVRDIIQSRGDYVTRIQIAALRALQEAAEMAIAQFLVD